jgi:hypothetical protein
LRVILKIKNMATSRAFAYNTGTQIDGTEQVGNLAIGTPTAGFGSFDETIKWWNGPDEDLGYVIAEEVPEGNQPNPESIPAFVGFWRSDEKTEQSFIDISNYIADSINDPQKFINGFDAKIWLNENGYWTSFDEL